jgi:uncharacterized protein YecE (DUF72 family)
LLTGGLTKRNDTSGRMNESGAGSQETPMPRRTGSLYIGTSGWSYRHWRGPFYPVDLTGAHMLGFYAGHFRSAEINNSFYQLPQAQSLQRWREAVPRDFVFAAKASRYITHMKKLKDPQASTCGFLQRMETLGRQLGPILFQLPPRWHFNAARLAGLLECLPDSHRYAFEFRDHSWHGPPCYRLLEQHNAAFCIYDLDGFVSPRQVTADFVYVRLHGPGAPYQGSYTTRVLAGWAGAFSQWLATGRDVYCYFDNDQAGYAAADAARLSRMLSGDRA